MQGRGLACLSLATVRCYMNYVTLLAALLFVLLIGALTRQMTTLLLMIVASLLVIPSVEVVVQVALLHFIYHHLSKIMRLNV